MVGRRGHQRRHRLRRRAARRSRPARAARARVRADAASAPRRPGGEEGHPHPDRDGGGGHRRPEAAGPRAAPEKREGHAPLKAARWRWTSRHASARRCRRGFTEARMARIGLTSLAGAAALAAGLMAAPAQAQPRRRPARCASCVINDLTSLDPVASTAASCATTAFMVYDQLFAFDSKGEARPQMVETYEVLARPHDAPLHLREASPSMTASGARGRCRAVHPPLGRARRRRPRPDRRHGGDGGGGRPHLHHPPRPPLRPGARGAGPRHRQRAVRHARAAGADARRHAHHRRHRLRPLHLPPRGMECRQPHRLSAQPGLSPAPRAGGRPRRRQDRAARARRMDRHAGPGDPGRRAAIRRDRLPRAADAGRHPGARAQPQHPDVRAEPGRLRGVAAAAQHRSRP